MADNDEYKFAFNGRQVITGFDPKLFLLGKETKNRKNSKLTSGRERLDDTKHPFQKIIIDKK